MEKELKKVRETSEFRLQEVHKDNEKLIKDVKALQEREDIEVILNKVHARHVFRNIKGAYQLALLQHVMSTIVVNYLEFKNRNTSEFPSENVRARNVSQKFFLIS